MSIKRVKLVVLCAECAKKNERRGIKGFPFCKPCLRAFDQGKLRTKL